ncbi:MAG: biopolymer transport protein ExbD [Verrucomicrobia bacterium]|nr:MAG: biopolymer transport protein ExbD [Verrucomicrobiota bacterium]
MNPGRRRIRRVPQEEVGLQIAPMIDVTLLLLFFFMLSGKLTKSAKLKNIKVPLASSSHTPENTGERDVINVDAHGDWFAGDQHVNTAELISHLKARFKNHPPLKLQVRADASTPAVRIKELMHLAADAGASEVVYGVRRP